MDNKIFTVERVNTHEQEYEYRAVVINDHAIFKGHFPQSPVVPGVCSLGMIKECVENAISRPVRYNYIRECKFLGAIIPSVHQTLQVSLALKQDSGQEVNVTAEVSHNGVKMMKLKATVI